MESTFIKFYEQVSGWPGIYVSEDGSVVSLRRKRPVLIKGSVDAAGYHAISTRNSGGKAVNKYRHRVVAEAFIENPLGLPEVNHKDGDKSNNHKDNLEWVTPKENVAHAIANGLRNNHGERHPSAKLQYSDVVRIREMGSNGGSNKDIAAVFNVRPALIWRILTGKTWRNK